MLRVLMLITDLQPGGTPLRIVRLARRLADRIEPIVGCLAKRGPLNDWLDGEGIANFSCDGRGGWDPGVLGRLRRTIDRYQPDVIHASLFHANIASRLCRRIASGPRLITSSVTIEIERRWHNALEALTIARSDVHVANSRAVASHVLDRMGGDRRKLVVIPNGLDLAAIDAQEPIDRSAAGLPVDVPLIMWAGRLDPIKNLPVFIEVIARVRRSRDIAAVLIGEGTQRERLERLIEQSELGDRVRITGWSDHVIGWMKAADVLLFPSLTEGSSNVILEAMASGCAVIASDIDSCREFLEGGRGLLVNPRDVSAQAAAVLDTLESSGRRQSRIRTARQYVEARHDLGRVADMWGSLYSDIV